MKSSTPSWQKSLANAITDPTELLQLLELDDSWLLAAKNAAKLFPLRVPRGFVARMQKNAPHDPLLRQVLPLAEEFIHYPQFNADPLKEVAVNPVPGLLHKYQGRVLLTIAGTCAINCRYCFRRHFPYAENNPGRRGWEAALEYIANDSTISEVIYSGGDPLIATDNSLKDLTDKIAAIKHVKFLRIHSRLPIVLPERICADMLTWFTSTRLQPIMVVHCNHPNEINSEVAEAFAKMQKQHITLLNQAVLLKGINDDKAILAALSERLFESNVLPYYLHMLDKVSGAGHFEVTEDKAREIFIELQASLPGYLVPKLVREVAGERSKMLVDVKG